MRSQEDRNIRNLYIDTAWQGVWAAGAATYLSVYLVRLGASAFLVSLLTSLPALLMLLATLPAAIYVEHQRNLMRVVSGVRLAYYAGPLALALLILLPLGREPLAIIVTWSAFCLALGGFNASWMAAMPLFVPRHRMLGVTGGRWGVNGAMAAVASAGFGALLGAVRFPLNYQIVFVLSTVAGLLALSFYRRIHIPEREAATPEGEGALARLKTLGRALSGNRSFLQFMLTAFIFRLAFWLPEGLYPVFWVRQLGASEGWIGVRTMVFSIALTAGHFMWGRMAGRLGRGRTLVICTAGLALYPALTAIAPSALWLPPIAVVRGLTVSGIEVVLFEAVIAKSPGQHRPSFIAASTFSDSLALLAGPLMGAGLAAVAGLQAALLCAAGACLISAALFRRLMFGEIAD